MENIVFDLQVMTIFIAFPNTDFEIKIQLMTLVMNINNLVLIQVVSVYIGRRVNINLIIMKNKTLTICECSGTSCI